MVCVCFMSSSTHACLGVEQAVLTCSQVWLAAGTQNGIELGLVCSRFVLSGRIQFLTQKEKKFKRLTQCLLRNAFIDDHYQR